MKNEKSSNQDIEKIFELIFQITDYMKKKNKNLHVIIARLMEFLNFLTKEYFYF